MNSTSKPTRPGGRSERVRRSVLSAVVEVVAEIGYDAMSIEQVADRAGVHKTTVYRRWATKPELMLDAAKSMSRNEVPIPDSGNLIEDLQLLARSVAANLSTAVGGRVSRSLVAASASAEDLSTPMTAFWDERMSAATIVIERAVQRGELDASVDPLVLIHLLVGPIWFRFLLTGDPIDDALADDLAALVAEAGAAN